MNQYLILFGVRTLPFAIKPSVLPINNHGKTDIMASIHKVGVMFDGKMMKALYG